MIYLKYGIYSGGELNWSESVSFQALEFVDFPYSERITGRNLRQVEFSHLASKRTVYKLIISADELLDSAKLSFCNEFFLAHAWKFSIDGWLSETETVLIEQGRMPKNLIENNKQLPEITFTLMEKYPVNL